jgi:transcriptional regulator with XRE-family HTH domain
VSSLKKALGKRIKQLREGKGWTQEELAARTEFAPRQIQFLEHGRHWPRIKTIERLAKELNAEPEDLFDFKNTT